MNILPNFSTKLSIRSKVYNLLQPNHLTYALLSFPKDLSLWIGVRQRDLSIVVDHDNLQQLAYLA